MKLSTAIYDYINENYNNMSKDELRNILLEVIYQTSEVMNEKQELEALSYTVENMVCDEALPYRFLTLTKKIKGEKKWKKCQKN